MSTYSIPYVVQQTPRGDRTLDLYSRLLADRIGYTRDELIGRNYRHFGTELEAEELFRAFNGVYVTGKPSRAVQAKIRRRGKEDRFVEISITLVRDDHRLSAHVDFVAEQFRLFLSQFGWSQIAPSTSS